MKDVFEIICQFTELEELNLNGNPVTKLPENIKDLSPNLSIIDLGEIKFRNFEDTVKKLQCFPLLKTLNILLTEESQVDLVMSNLHYIEYLNGLPVEREEPVEDDGRAELGLKNDSFGSDRDDDMAIADMQETTEDEFQRADASLEGFGSPD